MSSRVPNEGQNRMELSTDEEKELEAEIRQRFLELHNLIAKSQEFAKSLTDKSFYNSLEIVDNALWEKRDRIIKAFREFNSRRWEHD